VYIPTLSLSRAKSLPSSTEFRWLRSAFDPIQKQAQDVDSSVHVPVPRRQYITLDCAALSRTANSWQYNGVQTDLSLERSLPLLWKQFPETAAAMPSEKRRTPPKQADQASRIAYSDKEEEEQGGFTLTGAEALSSSPVASTSAAVSHEMPCTLNGLTSGLSGGALGYVFGFGKRTRYTWILSDRQSGVKMPSTCRRSANQAQRQR